MGVPRTHLGLRARLSLWQGGITLVICGAITLGVWMVSSHVLVERQRAVVLARTLAAAQSLGTGLNEPGTASAHELLRRVAHPTSTLLALWHKGAWTSTDPALVRPLRSDLATLVRDGSPRSERFDVQGSQMRAVGVALPHAGGYYFELAPTAGVDGTIGLLGITFAVGTIATSVVAAGLGWAAGGRVLRPLREVSRAAAAAAEGRPHARLDAEDDPDLGELARSFNRTTDALERRVRADARFAADVSHELRTPLTTMLNAMEVLSAQRDRLPGRAGEAADLLEGELHRFHQLVIDLLEISRTEGGEPPRLEPTRVGDAVRLAADVAAGRPVTQVDAGVRDLQLPLDRRRIERIVGNLVRNAEIHGRGCRIVSVTGCAEGVEIAVEDAGPGIATDQRSRVVERFVSGAGEGGSGLGLSIVAAHVRAHRGELRLEDRTGGGTRAVVTLPAPRRGAQG